MNALSARPAGALVIGEAAGSEDFLDWVVDGVGLTERYPSGSSCGSMTLLQSAEWLRPYRIEKLRRLRGEDLPPPTFEPRFRPSRLDRLLGKRGVPIAPFGAAFQDGRVALLLCACGDLDCPTLSANVVVNDATVEWRDVGWQVSYEPFEAQDVVREQPHMTFERSAYEALVADLLGDSI